MSTEALQYQRLTYLFMCTDPVHVGTGGYRLGRVDNSIAREPGTKVPKIPGTSLHGAARSYAASLYEKPSCAGQGQPEENRPGHCGDKGCPICYTFGYTRNNSEQEAYSGVVNVYDAHLLLFPVHSMVGPVWITTCSRFQVFGFTINNLPEPFEPDIVFPTFNYTERVLNLGWLVLRAGNKIETESCDDVFGLNADNQWQQLQSRIVLVPETLFSHLVNTNLEVRTSVAIDPERGAAEDKALFTYEALPRTAILAADVVVDDYRKAENERPFPVKATYKNSALLGKHQWNNPFDVLDSGLCLIEWLGVGGMGTRGFGRLSIWGTPKEISFGEEVVS